MAVFVFVGAVIHQIFVNDMFKAIPMEEGGERILYLEASNEAIDYAGERVLSEALEASREYYLNFGNVDLDHYTLLGPKMGIADYHLYEIGRPVEVQVRAPATFVKAVIYRGPGVAAQRANEVWSSLTEQAPAARWYPSIGGQVIQREPEIDAETGQPVTVVSDVRWSNIALSKTPVNLNIPTATTVPFGLFVKSWHGGLDLKALMANDGMTDVAQLTGGAALGKQSLDRAISTYWEFRDRISGALLRRKVAQTARAIQRFAVKLGAGEDEAAEWTERFMGDLKRNLSNRNLSNLKRGKQ